MNIKFIINNMSKDNFDLNDDIVLNVEENIKPVELMEILKENKFLNNMKKDSVLVLRDSKHKEVLSYYNEKNLMINHLDENIKDLIDSENKMYFDYYPEKIKRAKYIFFLDGLYKNILNKDSYKEEYLLFNIKNEDEKNWKINLT